MVRNSKPYRVQEVRVKLELGVGFENEPKDARSIRPSGRVEVLR